MKKSRTLLTALFTVVFFLHSCKKESEPQDPADSYVGIWLANDTLVTNSCGALIQAYNFTITKESANTIAMSGFGNISATTNATVTETAVALSSGALLSNFIGTKQGNTITYTFKNMCGSSTRGKATKQ